MKNPIKSAAWNNPDSEPQPPQIREPRVVLQATKLCGRPVLLDPSLALVKPRYVCAVSGCCQPACYRVYEIWEVDCTEWGWCGHCDPKGRKLFHPTSRFDG
jgi:hypothetical protein